MAILVTILMWILNSQGTIGIALPILATIFTSLRLIGVILKCIFAD